MYYKTEFGTEDKKIINEVEGNYEARESLTKQRYNNAERL